MQHMNIKELHDRGSTFRIGSRTSIAAWGGAEIPSDPAKSNRTPNLVYARAKLEELRNTERDNSRIRSLKYCAR